MNYWNDWLFARRNWFVDIWRIKNPSLKSFTWSQNSPMILCRLLDCWLISNNLQDSVSVTNILPAIKTDYAAISLDFNISQNHIKGPGYWKMNCFLLDDNNYQREVTAKMPVWLAQGRGCDLPDHRCIRDWIKHNLRAHAIQFSKRKVKEKKDKENILQDEFNNAKQNFECDPTNKNASECGERKIRTSLWRKTSRPDSRTGVMVRTRWKEYEIFSRSGEQEPVDSGDEAPLGIWKSRSGAPNDNIVQNHLNIALLHLFWYLNGI